ncbi:MAG: SURF1 family protein [Pseudomonadota bacterium]
MKKLVTVIVICGAIVTLAGLGTWQVQRLTWKQEIIENLEREYSKDPAKNIYSFEPLTALQDSQTPILYGSARGRFIKQETIFLEPKTYAGKVGAHVIQPFHLEDGGHILVNRGWISEEDKKSFEASNTQSFQLIQGIFRKPDWNRFTSNNNPERNIWTKADINQIAKYYDIERIAPVMLYATSIKNNQNLILQDAKWYPRNKHLQYAIFWYGMIFILLGLVAIAAMPKRS